MRRVLVFSLSYFPNHVGGAEVAVKEITDRIDDIEFHVVTHGFDISAHEEKIGNVHVHRIGHGTSYLAKALFVPRAVIAGLRLHRTHHFDAAWAMMSYMVFPLIGMRFLGTRLPFAITLQEGDSFEYVYGRVHIRLVRPLLRYAFRRASAVSAISTFLASWARQLGFTGDVRVIPNGVDIAHFSRTHPDAIINEIKDSLQKRMGDVFLITTSRLVHKNALDDVIRALTMLPANVHFVILGTGPDEVQLKKLTAELGVEERVRFLGHVSHDEMPKYLAASDIFIRPSRTEGMGNSFVEAFAAGLPVIATQVGGLSDVIFDEKRNPGVPVTGWAVDPNAPEQIAVAVTAIMHSPEKVRAVVASARAIANEKYDWELVAATIRHEFFASLLDV